MVDCAAVPYDRETWGDYLPVAAGAVATWTLPADAVAAPDLVQDHHVALLDAHLSGGCHWSAGRKADFARDPANLNPTTRSFNASKSNRTPNQLTGIAAGILDTPAEQCAYATQHQIVKDAWNLTMTAAERETIQRWLEGC